MTRDTMRILAQDRLISNNTRTTKLNNNDLIIGPTGAGKTRSYVKPNLLQYALEGGCSLIIADTKGSLVEEVGPLMAAHGYKVINLDFINLMNNSVGYNPLDFVSYDPAQKGYSEQEILTISSALVPIETKRDPFWEQSAQIFLSAFIGYALETLPPEEHTLEAVVQLYRNLSQPVRVEDRDKSTAGAILFQALGEKRPDSAAWQNYQMASKIVPSEKTFASIEMFLTNKLASLSLRGAKRLYNLEERINFQTLCREKTAVFLTISDTDRSMDKLVNLFYTQALDQLVKTANTSPGYRLPLPVRLILDDFAANVTIPDFDKTIAVIRSREISVSLIIQDINQLYSLYGVPRGNTIINNCDSQLYLGGQDVDTAQFISTKANKTKDTILNMPLDDAWLFVRGSVPAQVRKYDLTAHPLYGELPEAGGTPPPLPKAEEGKVGAGMNVPVLVKRIKVVLSGGPVEDAEFSDTLEALEKRIAEYTQEDEQEYTPDMADPDSEEAPEEEIPEDLRASMEEGPWAPRWGELPKLERGRHAWQIKVQRSKLTSLTNRLEQLLSGRDTLVLPLVSDQQGRYSEDAAWTLVGRLYQGVGSCTGTFLEDITARSFYVSFLYCAVRLCAICPPWVTGNTSNSLGPQWKGFHGSFDDILDMAQQAASQSEIDLYCKELYDPLRLDNIFGYMDNLYELFSGKSIKWTISEAAKAAAKDQYALEEAATLYRLAEQYSGDPPPAGSTADELYYGNYLGADSVRDKSDRDRYERWEREASARWDREAWAKTVEIPCKEEFCMHYRRLRLLLFRKNFQESLFRIIECTLDAVLLEEKASLFLKRDLFSQVCAQLDSVMASLKEQNTANN